MDKYLKIGKSKIKYSTLFFILFLAIAFYYNYQKILFKRPVGIHLWRNAVCASYAQNYYYGAKFLEPEVSNYFAENLTSDVAVAEFPGFYFLVGMVYKIFGFQEFLYRLINVIIGYLGLLALFKLTKLLINDTFYAFVIPVLIFTSNVFVFYLNNFIIDPTSLSLSFIGLYYFFKYHWYKRFSFFLISMLMFALAGLMKPPVLMIYFSLGFIYALEFLIGFKFAGENKVFYRPWKYVIPFLSVILIIFAWYWYSKVYTQLHGGQISPVATRSILSVTPERATEIWYQLSTRFKKGYFHSPLFLYFSAALFVFNLIFIKQFNRILNVLVILTFIQSVLFILLFYYSIGRCDYYQISNLSFITVLYLNFLFYLRSRHQKILKSVYFKLIVGIIAILLIHDCKKEMDVRYNGWFYNNSYNLFVSKYGDIEPYLRQLGIKRNDKVYVTPDPSIDISLYLMDQKGYTDFGIPGSSKKQKIENIIPKGLKYIIIGDKEIYQQEDLSLYLNNKIGEFKSVDIYKIDTNE